MVFGKGLGQAVAVYSALIGLLYVSFGIMEMHLGFGFNLGFISSISEPAFMRGDVFAGAMLVITGIVYLTGIRLQLRGVREGLSFLMVGALLSAVLFSLHMAIMGSNALGYALGFEDWTDWMWIDDIRPGMWLFLPVLPGAYLIMIKKHWSR